MKPKASHDIERAVRDGEALDRAILTARRRVIREHQQRGIPLVVWRDEQVVEIAPESIELPSDLESGAE